MEIYPPREDTKLILSVLRDYIKPGILVLDMGTGSGVIGKFAKDLGAEVLAVDINPLAVEEARKLGLNAIQSDLFQNVAGKFDLIVFNPPYLELSPEELKGEPLELALHGGKGGREVLDRFLDQVGKFLKEGGRVIFLQSERNGVMETEEKLKRNGFNFRILKREYVPMEGYLLVFLAWR